MEEWNYGLKINMENHELSADLSRNEPGGIPFDPENPPMELEVVDKRVPKWSLEGNNASNVPRSPVDTSQTNRSLKLSYGRTNLRITEFPMPER